MNYKFHSTTLYSFQHTHKICRYVYPQTKFRILDCCDTSVIHTSSNTTMNIELLWQRILH